MYFKRKVYDTLLDWKNNYANKYAALLEGARRVGKSTIAKKFAANEYKSFIFIDFSIVSKEVISYFEDISNLDLFFLKLQAYYQTNLYINESIIVFDEVQLFPKARQAIKHLVADGRYHYLETGSLISIKKNIKDILIPSEEKKIEVFPLDYEEFLWATNSYDYELLKKQYDLKAPIGQSTNRKLMSHLRIYMAIGGMPQAVEAYLNKESFAKIDMVKREIINLYEQDFRKIDPSGKISKLYRSIPAQLSKNVRRYKITTATKTAKRIKDDEYLYDLIDSKTVLISYNSSDLESGLSTSKDLDSYKLYLADIGLFVTLMFIDRPSTENEIYIKLLSDKLPSNLGYLYENLVAQMIASTNRELYYHTWNKEDSTHPYEIDFLISKKDKFKAIEVKSSGITKHKSIDEIKRKYPKKIIKSYVLSQKERKQENDIDYVPLYLTDFVIEE